MDIFFYDECMKNYDDADKDMKKRMILKIKILGFKKYYFLIYLFTSGQSVCFFVCIYFTFFLYKFVIHKYKNHKPGE